MEYPSKRLLIICCHYIMFHIIWLFVGYTQFSDPKVGDVCGSFYPIDTAHNYTHKFNMIYYIYDK